jgi:DNA repair exonuclease SbcCD ATPase subunit
MSPLGRLKNRPSVCLTSRPRDERDPNNLKGLKGGRLPSLMTRMITRYGPVVVITLSVLFLSGCSALFGEDPQRQANRAIAQANDAISEHNRSFEEARDIYAEARENIESGDKPQKQTDRIAEAKNTLEDARGSLQNARESIQSVRELEDVDPTVDKYAGLLAEAMDAQLAAESGEIEFYGILQEDPALENKREEALDLLSKVGDDYATAEENYGKAQELANSNPDVLRPESSEENTQPPPEPPQEDTTTD